MCASICSTYDVTTAVTCLLCSSSYRAHPASPACLSSSTAQLPPAPSPGGPPPLLLRVVLGAAAAPPVAAAGPRLSPVPRPGSGAGAGSQMMQAAARGGSGGSEGRDVDCGEKQADKHCMGSCDSASAPAVSLRDACACCALPPAAPAPVAAAGTGAAAPPPLAVVATPPVAIIAALLPVPLPLAWPLLFEGAGRRGTGRVSKGRAWQQRRAPAAVQSTAA